MSAVAIAVLPEWVSWALIGSSIIVILLAIYGIYGACIDLSRFMQGRRNWPLRLYLIAVVVLLLLLLVGVAVVTSAMGTFSNEHAKTVEVELGDQIKRTIGANPEWWRGFQDKPPLGDRCCGFSSYEDDLATGVACSLWRNASETSNSSQAGQSTTDSSSSVPDDQTSSPTSYYYTPPTQTPTVEASNHQIGGVSGGDNSTGSSDKYDDHDSDDDDHDDDGDDGAVPTCKDQLLEYAESWSFAATLATSSLSGLLLLSVLAALKLVCCSTPPKEAETQPHLTKASSPQAKASSPVSGSPTMATRGEDMFTRSADPRDHEQRHLADGEFTPRRKHRALVGAKDPPVVLHLREGTASEDGAPTHSSRGRASSIGSQGSKKGSRRSSLPALGSASRDGRASPISTAQLRSSERGVSERPRSSVSSVRPRARASVSNQRPHSRGSRPNERPHSSGSLLPDRPHSRGAHPSDPLARSPRQHPSDPRDV